MFKARNSNINEKYINRHWFFVTGYPVSVSGMITLPVSSSVYQSMVANIQQIHTNSDGTLCITPMQVQKSGHQSSVGQIASISSVASHTNNNNCSANSDSSSLIGNCQQGVNSQYTISPHIQPILSCDNQMSTNSNLLELCRVLSQSNQHEINSSGCFSIPLPTNHYHLSSSSNEKKVTKSKRNSSRNPFNMISANYESGTSSNNQQATRNNRNQIIHSSIKCQEDSNDTNNNINYEDSTDVINGDLKCGMITSNELSYKISKSENDLSSIHFDDIESKNIKSECDIDAA